MGIIHQSKARVLGDLFDIACRLQNIDDRYELYFDRLKKRYEIYVGGALQVVVPFQKLDARTLEFVEKTRVQNRERLLLEIEIKNQNTEEQARRETIDKMLAYLDL